jgi:hypothetical protein
MSNIPYPKGVPRQTQPEMEGKEHKMEPRPMYEAAWYKGSGKLRDKVQYPFLVDHFSLILLWS